MTKGKKKQTRVLLLLSLCMICAIIVYVILLNKGSGDTTVVDDKLEDNSSLLIIDYSTDEINSITVTNQDGTMTYVAYEDGVKNKDALDMPLNQGYGNNMFKGLSNMVAVSSLGEVESLSDYGLDNPTIQVTIVDKKDAKQTLLFGDEVPMEGGRYLLVEGEKEVFIVSESYYTYYNYSKLDMIQVTTLPTIPTEYITAVEISKEDEMLLSLSYDENIASDYSKANFWTLKAKDRPTLAASVDEVQNLTANYASYNFINCVDYNATDLRQYGLHKPTKLRVNYYNLENVEGKDEQVKVESTLELWIGDEVDDKYYVKESSSNSVHTMSKSSVEKLLAFEYFTLINKFVSLVNIKDVEKIIITDESKIHEIDMIETTQIEGTEEYQYTYKVNGNEIEEKTFKTFYQKLIGLKYDRDLVSKDTNSQLLGDEILSIIFYLRDGNELKVDYYDFDENYLKVMIKGIEYFLVDKREVNELLEELKIIE